MVYNAKFEVLTCSLSGIPVRIVLSKRELNPPIANPERISVSGFRIKQKDTDIVTEPINGSELSLTLISDTNFNTDVLETEDERDWRTDIFLNGDLYWSGFNLPEGLSKPYDNDRYDIGIKATDTLGNLKEVPFSDIGPYKGFDTDKNIIVKCLAKTGLTLPIIIGVNLFESHMNLNDCPLEQSSINQDRFIDSSSKSFSCHEVLRSILERYGAKLCQAKGAWYIVNTLEATKGNVPAWKYDYTGAFIQQLNINDVIDAGAAYNEAPVLERTHDISKARAFKSAMAYYQYGFAKNAITNGDFNNVAGGFFPGWEKLNGVNAGVADSTETDLSTGVTVITGHSLIVFSADTGAGQMVRSTNPIQVRANEKVTISFEMVVYNLGAPLNDYELQLIITNNQGQYFSKDGWVGYGVPYGIKLNGADIAENKIFNVNFEIPAGSTDYQLTFAFAQVYRKSGNSYSPRETHFDNLNLSVSVADAVLTPAVGEYVRLSQPKNLTYSGDAALLLHGDEASNLRTSQILVGANPTSQWNRVGFGLSENKPLLFIVADSILRLNSRPKNIFDAKFASKEIISPISLFNINQELGNYLVLSGEFDLLNEEYKLILFEGINDNVNIIMPYETGTDTGNLKDKTGVSIGQPSGINNPPSNPSTPNSGLVSRLSEANGYLLLDGLKTNAGFADFATNANHSNISDYATNANHANVADLATRALRADLADYALDSGKWSGALFADWLNQPVKTTSDVKFKSVGSVAFVSGFTGYGFQIDQNGNATFDNLTVRKQMNVYELTVNKINATNGALAVTDTIKIDYAIQDANGDFVCQIDTAGGTILVPFQYGDLVRCQVWNGTGIKYYFATVIYVNNAGSGFILQGSTKEGAGIPAPGDVLVRFGSITNVNRQGLLYLTASDTNAPYLDVLDGINSSNLAGKTKVRLGRLDGIVDPDFGALSGYGLYGGNVYLNNGVFRGSVTVTGGNAATQSYSQGLANTAQNNAQVYAQNAANAAQNAAQGFATNAANNASANAVAAANNLVNNLSIGGRNLLKDSSFELGIIQVSAASGNALITKSTTVNGGPSPDNSFRLYLDGTGDCYAELSNTNINNLIIGKEYTISYLVRKDWSGNSFISSSYYNDGVYNGLPITGIRNSWDRFSRTFTARTNNIAFLRFGFNSDAYAWMQIDEIKIEEGNKATAWSPAPEDNIIIATSLVNNIKIGGVNLLNNTEPEKDISFWNSNGGNSYFAANVGGFKCFVIDSYAFGNGIFQTNVQIKANTDYTISFDICGLNYTGGTTLIIGLEDISNNVNVPNHSTWTRISYTVNSNNVSGAKAFAIYGAGNALQQFAIKNIQLEEGNKATTWSASDFDINTRAQTAANTAQTAATNYATAQAAYEREVAKAYADGIVTAEEQARINQAAANLQAAKDDALAKANAAQAAAQVYANSQAAFEREVAKSWADGKVSAEEAARISQAAANLADAKADSQAKFVTAVANANGYTESRIADVVAYAGQDATSKANVAQTNAIAAASSNAQSYANTAQANAVAASQQLVNDLSIGAQNLVNDGNFERGILNITSGNGFVGAGYWVSSLPGTKCYNLDGTGDMYANFGTGVIPTIAGRTYTLSFDLIWDISGNSFVTSSYFFSGGNYHQIPFNVYARQNWARQTYTFVAPANNIDFLRFGFTSDAYSWMQIDNIKIEAGNKATAYSLSIDDTQGAINTAQAAANAAQTAYNTLTANLKTTAFQDITQWAIGGNTLINGGLINTNLLDAAAIRANIINAGYIESLEIVSKSIRTANSGVKRVEITQSTNSVILYSASNEELVRLDDNLAALTPGNPVTQSLYGAGIRVGNGGATTTISRYGFSVTGSAGELYAKSFIGTVANGYQGYVKLDVEGGFILNNIEYQGGSPAKINQRVVAVELPTQFGTFRVLGLID